MCLSCLTYFTQHHHFKVHHVVTTISPPFLLQQQNFALYGCATFCLFTHQLIDLWVPSLLAMMKNAAMIINVQLCVQTQIFNSLGYIGRSEILRSYGNRVFKILRNCQIFPKQLHHFNSLPAVYEGTHFSILLPAFVMAHFSSFSILSILQTG